MRQEKYGLKRYNISLKEVDYMSNTYNVVKKGLEVAAQRQQSISSNITNINTENYKANKIAFEEVLAKKTSKINMAKTDKKHFGIDNIANMEIKEEKRKNTYVNDNGNNVDLDLEMTELAANELQYSALVRQLNSKLSSLNYVINR